MQSGPTAVTSALPSHLTVHAFRIGDDRDMALNEAWSLLSEDEAVRANRFRFDRDRARYVRARGLLRRLLARLSAQNAQGLAFDYGPQGKPQLAGGGPAFNLSHSGDLLVIAVSSTGPVGVDVEHIDRKVNIAGLAEACMTPDEQRALSVPDDPHRAQRFFAFWTAKEARMKLTGEGMSLPPHSISLGLKDGWPVRYDQPSDPASRLAFTSLPAPGAVCCVCYPADIAQSGSVS